MVLTLLVVIAYSMTWREQFALCNALEVGRDEDPETWGCEHCNEANKPLKVNIIMDKSKEVKASLAVYEEHTYLAFRYTATPTNILQDVAYALQVDLS